MPKSKDEEVEVIHTDVTFEGRDVNASVIGWVAVGVVVAGFLIYGVVKTSYSYFTRSEFRDRQPVTLVKQQPPPPTVPSLQVKPAEDLERLQASEKMTLNSYGWVDQQKGIVRIPIDEAMMRVLAKGLPPAEQAAPTPVTVAATTK